MSAIEGHDVGIRLVPRMTTRRGRQWPKKWRAACSCGWRGSARLRSSNAWDDGCEHVDLEKLHALGVTPPPADR